MLWKEIKGRKLGFQFMRQKPIMGYIVDFYCAPLKLAIEIDGSSHDEKLEEDVKRQKEVETLDIHFLRFTEKEVRNDLSGVVIEIEDFIKNRKTTPASRTRHPL